MTTDKDALIERVKSNPNDRDLLVAIRDAFAWPFVQPRGITSVDTWMASARERGWAIKIEWDKRLATWHCVVERLDGSRFCDYHDNPDVACCLAMLEAS